MFLLVISIFFAVFVEHITTHGYIFYVHVTKEMNIMNKDYVKGMLGMAAVAVAIAFFLAWPNQTVEDSVEVANVPTPENGEVIKASLDPNNNDNESAPAPAGQEMIERAQAAADNRETQDNADEKDALEINVIAD